MHLWFAATFLSTAACWLAMALSRACLLLMGSGDTRPATLHQGTALSDTADDLVTTLAAAPLPHLTEFLDPNPRPGEQKMKVSLLSYLTVRAFPGQLGPFFLLQIWATTESFGIPGRVLQAVGRLHSNSSQGNTRNNLTIGFAPNRQGRRQETGTYKKKSKGARKKTQGEAFHDYY